MSWFVIGQHYSKYNGTTKHQLCFMMLLKHPLSSVASSLSSLVVRTSHHCLCLLFPAEVKLQTQMVVINMRDDLEMREHGECHLFFKCFPVNLNKIIRNQTVNVQMFVVAYTDILFWMIIFTELLKIDIKNNSHWVPLLSAQSYRILGFINCDDYKVNSCKTFDHSCVGAAHIYYIWLHRAAVLLPLPLRHFL